MNLGKLTVPERVVGLAGVGYIVCAFLPWASVSFFIRVSGGGTAKATITAAGVDSPEGIWVILGVIVSAAMVAQIGLARLGDVPMPATGSLSLGQLRLAGGVGVLVLSLLKLIAVRHYVGWATWAGILLGAAIAYGGLLMTRLPGAGRTGSSGA